MKINYLGFAIPLFLLFMLIEFLVARAKKLPYFKLQNSITNISIGIAERLLDVGVTGFFFFVYDYIQKHFGFFNIQSSLLLWVLLFICTDFVWYWYHRLAHEVNIFWAAHVVHHQSEDFNYTVSARITVLQAFVRTGFWAVLPLIGFPAAMITSVLLVHGLYPFFIHTRLIGKLGLLEYIFVTPSHHRVHHASNEKYLDKNFGDVLIIWDKLFGTFQKEEAGVEIQYGLTRPLNSYSFLWQHFHFTIEMIYAFTKTKGWRNKFNLLWARPDSIPSVARESAEQLFLSANRSNYTPDMPLSRYVIWQMAISLTALFIFVVFEPYIGFTQQWSIAICILLTLINCGAIMEQRHWIVYLEVARLVVAGGTLLLVYPRLWLVMILLIVLFVLIIYFERVREYYLHKVYAGQRVMA
jgi:alkylglycerol monooxygenase